MTAAHCIESSAHITYIRAGDFDRFTIEISETIVPVAQSKEIIYRNLVYMELQ